MSTKIDSFGKNGSPSWVLLKTKFCNWLSIKTQSVQSEQMSVPPNLPSRQNRALTTLVFSSGFLWKNWFAIGDAFDGGGRQIPTFLSDKLQHGRKIELLITICMAVIAREPSKIWIPNHPPLNNYNDQIISVVLHNSSDQFEGFLCVAAHLAEYYWLAIFRTVHSETFGTLSR